MVEQSDKPIQVNGNKSAVYIFDIASITEHINRIEAVITVANDYRIQTSMIYTKLSGGGHDTSGKNITYYNSSYWKTRAQSEGNIKDGSNVRTIKVDFGFQVASIIYGFDADINYRGFKINGEFVTNSNHYMFSDGVAGTGERARGVGAGGVDVAVIVPPGTFIDVHALCADELVAPVAVGRVGEQGGRIFADGDMDVLPPGGVDTR